MIMSRDVIFEEEEIWDWKQKEALKDIELMLEEEEVENPNEVKREPQTPPHGSPSSYRGDSLSPSSSSSEASSSERPRKTRSLREIYEVVEINEDNLNLFCVFMDCDPLSYEEAI